MCGGDLKSFFRRLAAGVVATLLSGCGATHTSDTKLIYLDGCVLLIEGLTLSQAEEMIREWEFNGECKVDVISNQNSE